MGPDSVEDRLQRCFIRDGEGEMMKADIGVAIKCHGGYRVGNAPERDHGTAIRDEERRIIRHTTHDIPPEHMEKKGRRCIKIWHSKTDMVNAKGKTIAHEDFLTTARMPHTDTCFTASFIRNTNPIRSREAWGAHNLRTRLVLREKDHDHAVPYPT
jgi:hypothetical protein